MDSGMLPKKRKLPKLVACMTKTSLENARNKALFNVDVLDAKGIRRRKMPLHQCLILELKEAGFTESSNYIQDLLYDNLLLVAEDDIGIVIDLRKREDYLEHICSGLQKAEKERERDNTKKECLTLLNLALFYSERGKGILWLAEKFFLAAMAVSSRFLIDGGRLKGCCKYHYAKFLLDKFPGSDSDEPYHILTEVRDTAIGKTWPLYEPENEKDVAPKDTLFCATAIQLHRVLLSKARAIRKTDTGKAERLARLAERRAKDAYEDAKAAEAINEVGICQLMMNNLNNALKTFDRAFKIYTNINDVDGLCETRMHLAAVMQRLGEHETAAKLLTEMGALAMDNGLRRQLGRALHLLGELHLRRERPELGTQHLAEAFSCFMGFRWCSNKPQMESANVDVESPEAALGVIYNTQRDEIYEEEAEQSRLMMAISAGQELMAPYFNLIRESGTCAVAKMKTMEWKLSRSGWWLKRIHHELLPCMCPTHNRTPLDILWFQQELKKQAELRSEASDEVWMLGRILTMEDFKNYRSSKYLKQSEGEYEDKGQGENKAQIVEGNNKQVTEETSGQVAEVNKESVDKK